MAVIEATKLGTTFLNNSTPCFWIKLVQLLCNTNQEMHYYFFSVATLLISYIKDYFMLLKPPLYYNGQLTHIQQQLVLKSFIK